MGSVDIHDVYKQIAEISKRFDAQKVVLFGSRARGTNGARSDIDLAVYGCAAFDKLYDALQEELWSLLTLDIIDMRRDVEEALKEEIARDGVILYEKYDYFCRHLEVLKRAEHEDLSNEFIISGIIDKFFIQFELGWKVMKTLLVYEGNALGKNGSPREIIKESYKYFGFMDEEVWLEMLRERNDTTYIYDGEAAAELVQKILTRYIGEFETLQENLEKRYGKTLDSIL